VGITVSGSTDPAGGSISYVLTDDAGGRFQISGGVVTVLDGSQIDFESSGGSYSITIVATDGNLNSTELTKTIFVGDAAPSDPVDSDEADNLVEQNVATGTPVGVVVSASDPAGGNVTFTMTDTAGGRFKINSTTGVISVDNGAAISYAESGGNYQVKVKSFDGNMLSAAVTFPIAVGPSLNDLYNEIDEGLEDLADNEAAAAISWLNTMSSSLSNVESAVTMAAFDTALGTYLSQVNSLADKITPLLDKANKLIGLGNEAGDMTADNFVILGIGVKMGDLARP